MHFFVEKKTTEFDGTQKKYLYSKMYTHEIKSRLFKLHVFTQAIQTLLKAN